MERTVILDDVADTAAIANLIALGLIAEVVVDGVTRYRVNSNLAIERIGRPPDDRPLPIV